MIGTISIAVEAKNPNLPLHPLRAFVNSPSSLRIINVPKKIGEWRITSVTLQAVYPDGSAQSAACVLVGGVWVGTLAGSATAGSNENGYTVYASGVDENGLEVEGYVLGKGDVVVLEADGKIPEGAFAELSAQVQGKRDLDDLALPAQPSETVPVWYGATECAWDAETSAWTSEDGFVEVTRRGTSDEYDVVAYSQLEPVETIAVRARVRLALPSFKAQVETAGGPVEVRSFDGFLATEEWTVQEISGKADLSALDGFATEEYVDQSVSSKAEASSLTAYATNDSLTAYATTEYVGQEVSGKADASSLTAYYTKSETSSAGQLGAALDGKQDSIPADQTDALSVATDDYKTTIWFDDGTTSSFAWYGTYDFQRNADAGLYDGETRTWAKNPVTVKIGRGVTKLLGGLNSMISLDVVYIPDSVVSVVNAFQGAGLKSVTLPYGLKAIGGSSFGQCDRLSSAYIPDTVEHIGGTTFLSCRNLKEVQFSKYLVEIGDSCFEKCSALQEVSFPDSLLSVGYSIFKDCSSLRRVEFGPGIQRIRHEAFYNCPALTCVLFKGKTMEQVSAMEYYPWSVSDPSIISVWNGAGQEWVMDEIPYSNGEAASQGGAVGLEDRAVQLVELTAASTTLALPALTEGKTTDFVVDVQNAYESGGTPAEAAFALSGTIGTDYAVVVPEGESLADMTTLAAGELAEFYFTRTAFTLGGLPTWKVVKQKVESWTPAQI